MVFRTPNMLIPQRLLVYLYSSNVVPRACSLNEARCSDIYLLDKILHDLQGIKGVPFASVALFQIRSTVRSMKGAKLLCYPLLLSKVFEFFRVDVTREDIAVSGDADVLTEANLYRMGHNAPVVDADDEEEHLKAPTSSALPSTSTGALVHPYPGSSVASVLQRIEAICIGLVTRQDMM
ncbi:hypothetical protein FNV43_RR11067 [Rhamnella rubrinervis]|uniref:Uncharacterized protein n=1 Tax=Rhamnella rubrinervis TaxID=2594499 RepID=A0A8K0H5K2_9ROSA|nr:hypothetical protein FNV43_RR11067 [Rhamnella rubrinervis]